MKLKMKSLLHAFLISFKTIKKAEKRKIYFLVLNTILETVQSFVFGVLFLKFLFEALFEKQNFFEVAVIIGIQAVWQIIYAYYNEWYLKICSEDFNAKIRESVYTDLFEKSVTIDMHTFESQEHRDAFHMITQYSANAVLSIVDNVFVYIKNIFCCFSTVV